MCSDRRIDRTSHGSGSVSGRDIDELSEHDYSYRSWHDFEDPDNPERTELLTLERLLTTALEKNSDIRFAIETKHPVRYGGYVERELADVLARFSLHTPGRDGVPPVRMMSFSWLAVRRMQRLAPQVPTVFLMDRICGSETDPCRRVWLPLAHLSTSCVGTRITSSGCTPPVGRCTCGRLMRRTTSICAGSRAWTS